MPAVFQIVSRASGKALSAVGLPEPTVITQLPTSDQDPFQKWTLQPQDSAEDFLIRSFTSPALAIGWIRLTRYSSSNLTGPAKPRRLNRDGGTQVNTSYGDRTRSGPTRAVTTNREPAAVALADVGVTPIGPAAHRARYASKPLSTAKTCSDGRSTRRQKVSAITTAGA